jgi:hypothetical protein
MFNLPQNTLITDPNDENYAGEPGVAYQHFHPHDRIVVAGRPAAKPKREAIPYINVPGPGQTWQQLNEWRQAFGLATVQPPA